MQNQDTWRAAARVRVLLAHVPADTASAGVTLLPDFWADADVRWLASVGEAYGSRFFNKEGFEELALWLEIPSLLTALARRDGPAAIVKRSEMQVAFLSAAAAAAGYNLDHYLKPASSSSAPKKRSKVPAKEAAGGKKTAAKAVAIKPGKTAQNATSVSPAVDVPGDLAK